MKRNVFLKVFSALSLGLVGFPFVFSCDVNCFGTIDGIRILLYYGAFLIIAGLGYFLAAALSSNKVLRAVSRVIGILSFGLGFISLPFGGDPFLIIALGLNSVFWYFIGKRSREKIFADIFPLYFFGIYIVLSLVCYIFMAIAAPEEIKALVMRIMLIAFMVEFSAAALLINQSGIFERANRRKDTRATLPKGLSGYNAFMVGTVAVILSLVCIFADYIADFLRLMIRFFIELYFSIISMFNAEEITEEIPEGGTLAGPGVTAEASEWWQVVAVLAFIAILFIFRKKIARAIKGIFSRLMGFLSSESKNNEEKEFYDTVEDYDSTKSRREVSFSDGRLLKLYKSEKNGNKKYRFGYRIILRKIKRFNPTLMPSDTTAIQAEKGGGLYGYNDLSAVAKCYERLRYNDENVTETELSDLDSLIRKET